MSNRSGGRGLSGENGSRLSRHCPEGSRRGGSGTRPFLFKRKMYHLSRTKNSGKFTTPVTRGPVGPRGPTASKILHPLIFESQFENLRTRVKGVRRNRTDGPLSRVLRPRASRTTATDWRSRFPQAPANGNRRRPSSGAASHGILTYLYGSGTRRGTTASVLEKKKNQKKNVRHEYVIGIQWEPET